MRNLCRISRRVRFDRDDSNNTVQRRVRTAMVRQKHRRLDRWRCHLIGPAISAAAAVVAE
jgi:hypothetical protein